MNIQQSMIIEQLRNHYFITFSEDFHTLTSSQVEGLLHWAKAYGYRQPKNANGSKARYFYSFLVRLIEKEKKESLK